MYLIKVKDSAIENNGAVEELVQKDGSVLEFESKQAAEKLAEELSDSDSRVRIQKIAPQDPADVDGYLINSLRRFTHQPKKSEKEGLTFEVTANQYGAIGEALICGSYGLSPALRYYIYDETEIEQDTHRLRGITDPYLPDSIPSTVSWNPDCLIQVYNSEGECHEMYFCEIKTGDASFERTQVSDMKRVASEYNVLKVRVDIQNLPSEYTVRINQVQSDGSPE